MLTKIGIYAVLDVAVAPSSFFNKERNEKTEKKNEIIAMDIGSFTLSQILYEYFKDYKMIPFSKYLSDKQEYIFPMAFNILYNQIFFPDNFKKILVDELLILSSIFSANLINGK